MLICSMSELKALKEEHEELMHNLRSIKLQGDAGRLFRDMMHILEAHFQAEEETVMPLLGAVKDLAEETFPKQESQLVDAFTKLKGTYEKMLSEHSRIRDLANRMIEDKSAKKAVSLLHDLLHHAAMEEEILYPTALLAGRLIKKDSNSI